MFLFLWPPSSFICFWGKCCLMDGRGGTDLFGIFVKGNVVILPCKGKMRNLLFFFFSFFKVTCMWPLVLNSIWLQGAISSFFKIETVVVSFNSLGCKCKDPYNLGCIWSRAWGFTSTKSIPLFLDSLSSCT